MMMLMINSHTIKMILIQWTEHNSKSNSHFDSNSSLWHLLLCNWICCGKYFDIGKLNSNLIRLFGVTYLK